MKPSWSLPNLELPASARLADKAALAQALTETRQRSQSMLNAWRLQLGADLPVPQDEVLNPMCWEYGHVGWFESWWIARNVEQLSLGFKADPKAPRLPPHREGSDAWFDSSTVAHTSRWSLSLPSIDAIAEDVAEQREATLKLLQVAEDDDDTLYFFRLCLLHEDMHNEAWAMMAQRLGLNPGDAWSTRQRPRVTTRHDDLLHIPSATLALGREHGQPGFAFDNEWGQRTEQVESFDIDRHAVTWQRYLPFVEAGGYAQRQWWSAAGWAWLQSTGCTHPQHLRKVNGGWQQMVFGAWQDLDDAQAACHLNFHEAQAWCRHAGRALPTEAQWRSAQAQSSHFDWGAVWEWTACTFAPFAGFEPHPYVDYSKPWFGTHQVLKGASTWTHPHMVDAAYRNFFLPGRTDVLSGFRSVLVKT
jgi:gamma-glutamyl hercynylcysteine S-oxide synthase